MAGMPLIPVSVLGSWAPPGWYLHFCVALQEQADRFGPADVDEAVRDAVRLAVEEQLRLGADLVSDGELPRLSMPQGFYERLTGIQPLPQARRWGAPAPDQRPRFICQAPVDAPHGLGVVEEYKRLRALTTAPVKVSLPGPFALAQGLQGGAIYRNSQEIAEALLPLLQRELRELAGLGVPLVQLQEPSDACEPPQIDRFLDVLARLVSGVQTRVSLHVCFGNYQGRATAWRSYQPLFPQLAQAKVHQLALEFAAREMAELELVRSLEPPMELAAGLVDVNNTWIEPPELVAERLRQVLRYIEPERVHAVPDCGFGHTARTVACRKLASLVKGVQLVRRELRA